jgi:aminopeptidase-like protein
VYDWEVPLEWNIEDAAVLDADGDASVDFQKHNLHVVSYSEPVADGVTQRARATIALTPRASRMDPVSHELLPAQLGFPPPHETRQTMRPDKYRVEIKELSGARLADLWRDRDPWPKREEVLFFTHVCHPSLANDNTSGMAIATALAGWIAGESRRYSYRFVFAPGPSARSAGSSRTSGVRAGGRGSSLGCWATRVP